MSVAIRAITRLQDADDVAVSLGAGQDGYVLTYSHSVGGFVLAAGSTRNWYVDSVNGDDTNTGLSADEAFATIAKLLTVIAAGHNVWLATGSTWREELLVPANNISIRSYGGGAKPLLDCSSVIAAVGWTKTVGQTNVYQATVSPALEDTETWVRVWEDDVSFVRASSVANCDSTPGSYYPSSDTTAPITLYVHASDGSDPAASGKIYETNLRKAGINGSLISGLIIDGIHTRRNLWGLGSIVTGPSAIVRNCLCEDGTKHNIYTQDGAALADVTCKNAYYGAQNSTLFVTYQAVATGLGITMTRCRAEMDVYNGYVSAFYFHNSGGADTFGDVTFTDLYAENCLFGLEAYPAFDTLEVDGFTCVDVDYAIYARKTSTFKNVTANIKNQKRLVYLIDANAVLTLEDCTITMDAGAVASGGVIYAVANNVTVDLTNVTFATTDATSVTWIALNGTGNVINATGCDYGILIPYSSDSVTLNSDYNRFRFSYLLFVVNGTTYNSVAAYQAGTGQDAHSTVG